MSDERNDDELLGRALSRAIETQDVRETPYERSRLAVRPLRRGLPVWQTLGVAAALLLAVAFGAWFTRPSETIPVAASGTPTATSAATAMPQTAVPTTLPTAPLWVYFTRDSLPPIGADVTAAVSGTAPKDRIDARFTALHSVAQANLPQGASDPFASVGRVGSSYSYGLAVKIDGDLATLTFQLPNGWGISDASQAKQLVQQIVYTATEEFGIRRVLILEDGKTSATIDRLKVDKPLTREDVSGYEKVDPAQQVIDASGGQPKVTSTAAWSVDPAGGPTRFTLAFTGPNASVPAYSVTVRQEPDNATWPGKWTMTIAVDATGDLKQSAPSIAASPLRGVDVNYARRDGSPMIGTQYVLHLDDLRPWRIVQPTRPVGAQVPAEVTVDIGGIPGAISDRIALFSPLSTVGHSFTLAGDARTFEANVVWRVKDASGKVVAQDHTTASLGTNAVWGSFSTQVALPSSVSGNVTLEVYEVSPKDGSEQGLVSIPLVVR